MAKDKDTRTKNKEHKEEIARITDQDPPDQEKEPEQGATDSAPADEMGK